MKKVMFALALCLALLCACNRDAAESQSSTAAESTAETQAFSLSDLAVADGFYDLTLLPELEDLEIADAALMDDDTLLLLTGPQQDTLVTLDVNTGAVRTLAEIHWNETISPEISEDGEGGWIYRCFLSADPIAVYSTGEEEQCFLVETDGTVQELPMGDDGGDPDYYSALYFSDALYWYTSGKYGLQRLDFGTLEVTQLFVLPPEYLYPVFAGFTEQGEAVFLADVMGSEAVTMTLSPDSGEITALYSGYCSDVLVSRLEITTEWAEDSLSEFFVTAFVGQETAQATFSATWLSLCPVDSGDYIGYLSPAHGAGENRGLLVMEWATGDKSLILWEYGAENLAACEAEALTAYTPKSYETTSERAKEMMERYGIVIYTGDAVLDCPVWDYTLSVYTDSSAIDAALDALEEAFSRYPEGYLAQLGGSGIRAICVYLSGEMTPVDASQNISAPGGLCCQVGDLEIIALDASGYVRAQDIIHELTHILDHQLWGILDEEIWNSMNPEGFDYPYAYIDENGNSYEWGDTAYTTWDGAYYAGDLEAVYFIDPYSTTYPTEDRARLMEYLLADPENGPEDYFASSHIQQKLTYYFQCIRQAFDTTLWPEETVWEAELRQAIG